MGILIVDALAANEGRRKFSRDAIGVGPRLIAGISEKQKAECLIVRVEDLLDSPNVLKDNSFDAVLISAMSVDKIAVERAIKVIRENTQDLKIILGGPILSEDRIIQKLDINVGVYGEGEWIIEDLLKNNFNVETLQDEPDFKEKYSIEKIHSKWKIIQNKSFRKDVFSNFSPSIKRIIDYPDYWFSKVYVEITRGCSNHYRGSIVKNQGGCSDCGNCEDPDSITTAECPEDIPPGCGFCSVPATFGPPRSKEVKLVLEEVDQLFRKGVRRIYLSSPGFLDYFRGEEVDIFSPTQPSANVRKITELLEGLASIRDQQSKECSISIENVKPTLVTKEIANIIGHYLPNTAISIGCETFDSLHSSAIGRPSSPQQALEVSKYFIEANISPQIYLIHSLPGETVTSLEHTKNIVENQLHAYAEKITVYKYLPLPNSPFTVTQSSPLPDRHLLNIKREELKQAIIKFNFDEKKKLIGSIFKVIVAERDSKRDDTFICYPIWSGPAVSVFSSEKLLGRTIDVKIKRAITDKLLEGEVHSIKE